MNILKKEAQIFEKHKTYIDNLASCLKDAATVIDLCGELNEVSKKSIIDSHENITSIDVNRFQKKITVKNKHGQKLTLDHDWVPL